MRNNVVPVHVFTHSIYPEKPVPVEGSEYKKDGGEWAPMGKEDNKNGK